jgi:predicted permease
MGRLRPGVSLAQAQAVLARRFELFAAGTASSDEERGDLPRLHLESGAGGLDSIRRQYAHALLVLVSLVAVLLLIACSNIASLLIARTAARRQEIGIRLSLGSSRSRVIRQLLTESLVLSLAGGALGIAIAWSSIRGMTVLLSSGREHFTLHAELNASVLAMTFGISVLCGMLFGLAPALQAARASIAPFLKDRRGGPTFVRTRSLDLRHGLLVAQIALSLVLLVTAGLFGRTLSRLHGIELGFARDNILLFTIRPSSAGYGGPALTALYENVRARLAALPGVEAVSLSVRPLPAGGGSMAPIDIAGSPERSRDDSRRRSAALTTVGPDFFATMRMPLAAGREFTERDVAGSARVVVVNRAMARLFGLENPVGRTLTFNDAPYEIVGLVDDALAFFLKEERRPIVYFSYLQNTRAPGQMTYELRTAGPPGELATAVRELVRGVDSRLAIHDLKTQADHVDQAISMEIVLAKLCSMFAALALAIAAVGIYGTVAFNVARRTTEIGIRMALGARSGRVMWMVQRDVLLTAAAAFAVGLPLAMIVSRAVESLLYGIRPADPVSIGLGVGAVLGCALTAGFVPARRAARIDPVSAIRSE